MRWILVLLVTAPLSFGCSDRSLTVPKHVADAENESTRAQSAAKPEQTSGSSKASRLLKSPSAASPDGSRKALEQTPSLDELLLFFPAKYPAGNWKPDTLDYEDAWFEADDGVRLHGWYCPAEAPRGYVLFAHGNAGNLSHCAAIARTFQRELRLATFVFDYRGYGRSEGTPTVEGVLKDAHAAMKEFTSRAAIESSRVILMGRSLGGAVAVQLAADTGPRALILESTFSSLKEAAQHHYPKLAWLVPENKLNSAARISSFKGPLLLSHGDSDRTVPCELGMRLYNAAGEPKTLFVIEGGDHNDPQPVGYYRKLDEFIRALP